MKWGYRSRVQVHCSRLNDDQIQRSDCFILRICRMSAQQNSRGWNLIAPYILCTDVGLSCILTNFATHQQPHRSSKTVPVLRRQNCTPQEPALSKSASLGDSNYRIVLTSVSPGLLNDILQTLPMMTSVRNIAR